MGSDDAHKRLISLIFSSLTILIDFFDDISLIRIKKIILKKDVNYFLYSSLLLYLRITKTKIVMKSLQKQALDGPQYIVRLSNGLYVSNSDDEDFTTDRSKAERFSVLFDNRNMKTGIWAATYNTKYKASETAEALAIDF